MLERGEPGLLAVAVGLFGVHQDLGGPGELDHGQGLAPPGHHGALQGQARGQRLQGLLGLLPPEERSGQG